MSRFLIMLAVAFGAAVATVAIREARTRSWRKRIWAATPEDFDALEADLRKLKKQEGASAGFGLALGARRVDDLIRDFEKRGGLMGKEAARARRAREREAWAERHGPLKLEEE